MSMKSKHKPLHLYVARPSRTMAGRHKQTLNCAEDPVATQTSSPVQVPENAAVPARMAGRPMSRCHKNMPRNLAGSSPCLTKDNDLFTRIHRSGRRWCAFKVCLSTSLLHCECFDADFI